jgi:hypothetical protein
VWTFVAFLEEEDLSAFWALAAFGFARAFKLFYIFILTIIFYLIDLLIE